MLNKLVIPDIFFDFDTEDEYHKARRTGYIPDYSIARLTVKYSEGGFIDFPCHCKEDFLNSIKNRLFEKGVVSIEAYHSIHCFDISDYD